MLAGAGGAGSVALILGPMFSGKSTELLRRIRRYTVAQRKCLVVKYSRDTRYSTEKMSTHDRCVLRAHKKKKKKKKSLLKRPFFFFWFVALRQLTLLRRRANFRDLFVVFVHYSVMWEAFSATKLAEVPQKLIDEADVIGVDEGQVSLRVFCLTAAAPDHHRTKLADAVLR